MIPRMLIRGWLFGGLTDRGLNLGVAEPDTVGGLAAGLPRPPALGLLRIVRSSCSRVRGAGGRDQVGARLGGVLCLVLRDGANLQSNQRHACAYGYFVVYSGDASMKNQQTNGRCIQQSPGVASVAALCYTAGTGPRSGLYAATTSPPPPQDTCACPKGAGEYRAFTHLP